MKENETKKKRTLTISSKKTPSFSNYSSGSHKKSFVIEKKISRKKNDRAFFNKNTSPHKSSAPFKPSSKPMGDYADKRKIDNRSFEIRKKAEERAKNRFKNPEKAEFSQNKKGGLLKGKTTQKREYKLTLSKVLADDAMEGKGRSLASIRRARVKEKQNQNNEKVKVETKKIIHEVNIPNKILIL